MGVVDGELLQESGNAYNALSSAMGDASGSRGEMSPYTTSNTNNTNNTNNIGNNNHHHHHHQKLKNSGLVAGSIVPVLAAIDGEPINENEISGTSMAYILIYSYTNKYIEYK